MPETKPERPRWAVVWDRVAGGSDKLPAEQQEALKDLLDAIETWHLDVFEAYSGPHENVIRRLRNMTARVRGLGASKAEVWTFITHAMKPEHMFRWDRIEFDPYNPRHVMALLYEVVDAVGSIRSSRELNPNKQFFFSNSYQKQMAEYQTKRINVARLVAKVLTGSPTTVDSEIAKHLPGDHPHPKKAYQHTTRPRWRRWEDDIDWIRDDGVKLSRSNYGPNSSYSDVWMAHGDWRLNSYSSITIGNLADLTLEEAMDKLEERKPARHGYARDIWQPNVPVETWI